ncbi:methyltransferase domain-containing protein [Nocardioides sp. YIM 123512]|uniref:Methyltransferase domain-containing protein n=1 Tax=Nocardioides flavescens TaxID=2691959 RepID=A0A6L7ER61_9ACTN|nr:methyltransferase domain-containing protein [Nocardioides flavescens]
MSGDGHALRVVPTPCRACGATGLVEVLDLGSTPVANALVPADRLDTVDPTYPLALALCERCALAQLTESLPGEALFDADYPYFSSFAPAVVEHARRHVEGLVARRGLGPESLVLEIASNDGYLLQHARAHGVRVLGVDPSAGPAAAAEAAGIPTVCDFLTPELARRLVAEHGRADVVVANNVAAHVPDLDGFVEALATCVADDGVVTVENPWVRDLVQRTEFDTIYHEHHSYLSCTAISRVAERHGLHLVDVEHFPDLHGGTLRWTLARSGEPTPAVADHLALEDELGLGTRAFYGGLAARTHTVQRDLRALLTSLRAEGATVAAYGAAAKGVTMLVTSGIGADLVDYVVDRSPHKQGMHLPGARIPVEPVEVLPERRPDFVLVLAWNFVAEIARQQRDYLEAGGRFIVPVPSPRVLTADDLLRGSDQ